VLVEGKPMAGPRSRIGWVTSLVGEKPPHDAAGICSATSNGVLVGQAWEKPSSRKGHLSGNES
jgi:hypothetical protein